MPAISNFLWSNTVTSWILQWSHGQGSVEASGAMLAPVTFMLPDGRQVQPFAVFPWAKEALPPGQPALTGLMANGRGEWPCVPFGGGPAPFDHPIHGWPAHDVWQRLDDGGDLAHMHLRYDFPADSPVDSVERLITGVDGQPEIQCRLRITVRRACALPLGLHPTLRLPERPGALRVTAGDFAFGITLPREHEPGADVLQPGAQFAALSHVPGAGGQSLDLSHLPLAQDTESLVQLCGSDGRMTVSNFDEGYAFALSWDATVLPSCLLWISNGGRQAWPWSGRHYALGVEPVCSYFDWGVDAGTASNPVSARGVATCVQLDPAQPLEFDYRMTVGSLTS